ncbi:MAG TPA: replication-relaxation family protein [Urbifossiella sp.]|nr:replication-relaxation family protein [Urbifossiella sp.]
MNVFPAFGTSRESLAYARARDERIVWLLTAHPVTAGMLVALGWFPTRAKAVKRLRRLAARRRVRFVGTVCRAPGRPEHVFCRWQPKADNLLHEVELTDLCFRLDAARILRGPHVTDTRIRPDAEVWINGRLYYLEHDRGTMAYPQVAGRFRLYEGFPHFVLWVCSTEERRDGLRARAEPLRPCALFTTFHEASRSPHEPVWLDYGGRRAALPRETPSPTAG